MRTALTYRDSKHESFYAFHKSTFVFKKAFPISGKSELNPKIVSSRSDAESIFEIPRAPLNILIAITML
jgi:hypothetical protein